MRDFTVHRYGTDSSGRGIFMTAYMHDWWDFVGDVLTFPAPPIVQGAFMVKNGGGARASDGAHDQGGCIDVRTRDLTTAEIDELVKVARTYGGGANRRDPSAKHGAMEAHCHITLGTDHPLSSMAQTLWNSYLAGGDGLAAGPGRPGNAPDYEWRPHPMVKTPPELNNVQKARAILEPAITKAGKYLDEAPKSRTVVHNQAARLRNVLKMLPKK